MTISEGDRVEYKIAILRLGCHQCRTLWHKTTLY